MSKTLWQVLLLLPLCRPALTQGPNDGFVSEAEGHRHVLVHGDPLYPPIAKAAHVQGSVLLHVDVDEQGRVTNVEAIGGPGMLKGAAMEAVRKWSYSPFLVDRKAVAVHVIVTMPFSLGIPDAAQKSDEAIGQAYFPMADQCRSSLAKGQWDASLKLCGDAMRVAERFPYPAMRSNELRLAHEEFGEALAFSGDLAQALVQFHQTTELARNSLTETDEEYADAYYWQAFAEHASKMPAEAERDYEVAEASFRKAMIGLPEMKALYGRELAHTLAYHSVLLEQTGHEKEARAARAEAKSLDPHALESTGGDRK